MNYKEKQELNLIILWAPVWFLFGLLLYYVGFSPVAAMLTAYFGFFLVTVKHY